MSAGSGSNDIELTVADAQARLDSLNADRAQGLEELESLDAEKVAVKETLAGVAVELAAAEQALGDALALEECRNRGGVDGVVLARSLAATMPDPARAARFTALADELAGA